MKAEDLMKPRFEVIADYPNNKFGKVGTILDRDWGFYPDGEENEPKWSISQYPHLFRKLNWWEHRKVEDMPKKVKAIDWNEVYEIHEWDMVHMIGFIDSEKHNCCDLLLFKPEFGYFPVD